MSKKILQAVREASVSIATCLDEPNEVSKKDLEHIQNQITKIENYLTPFYLEELEDIKSVDNKLENTLDFIRDDICELNNKISDICVKLNVQEQD